MVILLCVFLFLILSCFLFLKGVLIYVPDTSRAGIAVLVCMVAVANLNYFRPHKNKVLFWLSQISFLTTGSKYVISLLISSKNYDKESEVIGKILIFLDLAFMASSAVAVVMVYSLLLNRVAAIDKQHRENDAHNSVKIVPTEEEGKEINDCGSKPICKDKIDDKISSSWD